MLTNKDETVDDDDDDNAENEEEKSSKINNKKSLREGHQLQEIDCEDIGNMQRTLTQQIFQGFLKRIVPREEMIDEGEMEIQIQQQSSNDDNNNNNAFDSLLKENNNNNNISNNNQLLISNTTQQEHNFNNNNEEQVPFTSFSISSSAVNLGVMIIITPYSSFDSLHPVVLDAFAECEKHERLDFEGNDQLGVGKRKKKNNKFGTNENDDDADNNNEESGGGDDDDDDLEMMFFDSVPASGVLEKIMQDEEFSDEEDAFEFWREKQIEKEKAKKRAKILAKKLQEQFGAEIDFENSFSMFVEAFPEKINNLQKHQLKNIKLKFSLRQLTLKTRTQYRSDFLSETKELFLKKHKSFLEK